MRRNGLGHQAADDVVANEVKEEFLLDHFRGLAAQFLHAHGGLDGAEVELRVPAAFLQSYDFLRRIERPVPQACQEAELFGARFPQGLRQGVFGANGDFFATVTGLWGKRTGAVWRLRAGAAEPETVSPPMGFLGGIALGADGAALYVAESDSNTIYRLELGADARVGAPQAFARECGRVPVGLAADAEGSVYAACYASDEIWKAHPDGGLSLIAADPWSWRLSGPSALAFGGPDNAGLYVCNSGKAHVSRLRPGSKGPAPVGLSAAKKLRLRPSPL